MTTANMRWATICFGKVNFRDASQSVAVLAASAPFKRETALNAGRAEQSSKQYLQATRNRDIGGGFTRQRIMFPEGTLLVLQAARTERGVLKAEAVIFLRVREGADHLVIHSHIPTAPDGYLGSSVQIFTGEADILTAEEVCVTGVRVPHMYIKRYCNEDEVQELFEIQVARKGNLTKPQLVAMSTSEGLVVKAIGSEASRRIKIRRT